MRLPELPRTEMRNLAMVAALGLLASCGRNQAAQEKAAAQAVTVTETIKGQIAQYLAAVDAADSNIGGEVWLNSPDISFIWPLGHEHGWDAVKKVYGFFDQNFSNRKLTARDISVHVMGDSAWAEFYWHFDAKQKSDGSTVATDGLETQIYRRVEPNRWALVHAHYSALPTVRDPLN